MSYSSAARSVRHSSFLLLILTWTLVVKASAAAEDTANVNISWNKIEIISTTTPTLQVVVNPPLRRESKIHNQAFRSLQDMQADYVRFVPWLPYPKLGVAELQPPSGDQTFWDFSSIDPLALDFLEATAGHPVVINFSTIPQWMFRTEKPVAYPADANEVTWIYEQGTELRDPSMQELSAYYARLFSWYTQGGFTDELGRRHESGYHYKIDYWEVLNEPEYEHAINPQIYTRMYDAIVSAIRKIAPQTKFVGMSLAVPSKSPEAFEYFLDQKNHEPGIPLDAISYHFYAVPAADQSDEVQQFTFFEQADHFIDTVRFIESVRRRLSPTTRTMINEVGTISADDLIQAQANHVAMPPPASYWNLSGALYAYLYAELTRLGIDVVGESQLVGFPTQFPSVSMLDWNTGTPNARYWVLKLLRDNFGPGSKLVETQPGAPGIYAQGFVTASGKRKLLLINKRDRTFQLVLPAGTGTSVVEIVDQHRAGQPASPKAMQTGQLSLDGFAVAIVTWPDQN